MKLDSFQYGLFLKVKYEIYVIISTKQYISEGVNVKKTIGVFAHVDAGKTTFSEQVLYHTKTIRKPGRVDNRDSFLDSHFIEKERGITIYSDIARFRINDNEYFLLDTPGHIDFSTEMERSISILDYAVLIISAVEGIQGHTETLWSLLRENNIPTFIFINKIDRDGANADNVLEEVKRNFSNNVITLDEDSLDNISEELIEFISERDEDILEDYMNDNVDEGKCIESLIKMIRSEEAFICMKGSALLDIGIKEFIDIVDKLTFVNYIEEDNFKAKVNKIRYDKDNNRVAFLKVISGKLKVKDIIDYEVDSEVISEKINAIRLYNGEKFESVDEAIAGEICAVIGLSKIKSSMTIGGLEKANISLIPTLSSKVIFDDKLNVKDVLRVFRILEDEDCSLNICWNEEASEITINIMGEIQLEVIKEVCEDRFNLKVDFGDTKILYKETISGKIFGYGHFEPLKHYAEVHLMIEGLPKGSGICFESTCHTDNLNTGQMNLVKTHIFEKVHKGVLTGSPLTDMKITLINGRAHNKHTEGGDFREATKRALRQGLEYAENVLLEPYYKFNIQGDINLMGRFISDIQKMKGRFNDPILTEDRVSITGIGPVETFRKYPLQIQAISKGKARISLIFEGYLPCHNKEKVIECIGYDRNKDSEYTSSSIFCSKGVGYSVEASLAKAHMHAEIL